MEDNAYVVMATPYGDRHPDPETAGDITYTKADVAKGGKAWQAVDDNQDNEYDSDAPAHWGVYELVPVPSP